MLPEVLEARLLVVRLRVCLTSLFVPTALRPCDPRKGDHHLIVNVHDAYDYDASIIDACVHEAFVHEAYLMHDGWCQKVFKKSVRF